MCTHTAQAPNILHGVKARQAGDVYPPVCVRVGPIAQGRSTSYYPLPARPRKHPPQQEAEELFCSSSSTAEAAGAAIGRFLWGGLLFNSWGGECLFTSFPPPSLLQLAPQVLSYRGHPSAVIQGPPKCLRCVLCLCMQSPNAETKQIKSAYLRLVRYLQRLPPTHMHASLTCTDMHAHVHGSHALIRSPPHMCTPAGSSTPTSSWLQTPLSSLP